jgi:Rad3-related DNA helicase
MKKVIRLTERDLTRLVRRVVEDSQTKKNLNLRRKLNDIFFGRDESNIFSEPNEFGYLSSEHRLSKIISPKQRTERIQQVIDELEDYIRELRDSLGSEESFIKNPEYDNIWKDVDGGI